MAMLLVIRSARDVLIKHLSQSKKLMEWFLAGYLESHRSVVCRCFLLMVSSGLRMMQILLSMRNVNEAWDANYFSVLVTKVPVSFCHEAMILEHRFSS